MEEKIELTPEEEERRKEQDNLVKEFGGNFGIKKIFNSDDRVEDCKVGYYLIRPYSNYKYYKNHIVLAKVCKDKNVRIFDTLSNNTHYSESNEYRNENIKSIFKADKISSTDIRLKSDASENSQANIIQQSSQGCFEMCLALAMLHSIRKENLKKIAEIGKVASKQKEMNNLIKNADAFAEMIHLKTPRDQGTKDVKVKEDVKKYFKEKCKSFKEIEEERRKERETLHLTNERP